MAGRARAHDQDRDRFTVADAGGTDLRPAHGNAMEMLAIEDGLRLTDIAARAGMAPQSMVELVDDLVAKRTCGGRKTAPTGAPSASF